LPPGTALQLVPEDHQHDRFALRLEDGATQLIGYCPRYLNQSLRAVMRETRIRLTVARNNCQAPIQFRLLCEARFPGKAGQCFYESAEHQPLTLLAAA
ncbi:MAG: hypothetical protein V2I45_02070, partial [Halieaceae bacterium]|nr:hypothetical protein [Halieaceae bacterium]